MATNSVIDHDPNKVGLFTNKGTEILKLDDIGLITLRPVPNASV